MEHVLPSRSFHAIRLLTTSSILCVSYPAGKVMNSLHPHPCRRKQRNLRLRSKGTAKVDHIICRRSTNLKAATRGRIESAVIPLGHRLRSRSSSLTAKKMLGPSHYYSTTESGFGTITPHQLASHPTRLHVRRHNGGAVKAQAGGKPI